MIEKKIDCLEHGYILLDDVMGSDYKIYRNAKVSTGKERDIEDQKRLINYLVSASHSSPLEFLEFSFRVKAPIYVFRQWQRHRVAELNEYSLRYRRIISDYESVDDLEDLNQQEKSDYKLIADMCLTFYNKVFDRMKNQFPGEENLPKRARVREKLRGLMGTAFYSEMYWKANLHSIANFWKKRSGEGAQQEIKVYSDAMFELCYPHAPITIGAINKHWLNGKFDNVIERLTVNWKGTIQFGE